MSTRTHTVTICDACFEEIDIPAKTAWTHDDVRHDLCDECFDAGYYICKTCASIHAEDVRCPQEPKDACPACGTLTTEPTHAQSCPLFPTF